MDHQTERIIGRFYAQHAHMITEDVITRAQANHKHNIDYRAGNILLLNTDERLVIPFNLIAGDVTHGPWVNQVYEFELITPPGKLPNRLEAIRGETLDTTLLKIAGPFGPDSLLQFVHTDYEQGRGAYSTILGLNNIGHNDQGLVRRLFEENPNLLYRIDKLRTADNLYK